MERTGYYRIPVFNVLEGHFKIVLAKPEEVKNRKGHKTDRKDAEHLADLLRHNHVRASYIPPEPVRQLRDLTRRRIQLTQDASRERNRVQKLLEQANVKIASVLSDVFGVTGQNLLLNQATQLSDSLIFVPFTVLAPSRSSEALQQALSTHL